MVYHLPASIPPSQAETTDVKGVPWVPSLNHVPSLVEANVSHAAARLHAENEQDWQNVYPSDSDTKTTRKDTFQHNTNLKCLDLEKENASSVNSPAQPLPGLCLVTSKCMTTSICQS